MFLSQWGLEQSPFSPARDLSHFFSADSHAEAQARFEFLTDAGRALGLLVGPAGCGKTLALHVLGQRQMRRGFRVAKIGLFARSADDLLWELASQLGGMPKSDDNAQQLWQRIEDQFIEHRTVQTKTLLLFDDVEDSDPQVQSVLARLLSLDDTRGRQMTMIATCRNDAGGILSRLLDQVDLRIDLEPFSPGETGEFVQQACQRATDQGPFFSEEVLATLHESSGGVPREVIRLAELAMLAAAGQGQAAVTEEAVQDVAGELVLAV